VESGPYGRGDWFTIPGVRNGTCAGSIPPEGGAIECVRNSRQLSVLTRIHDLVHQKSQFIIATHSPILMAYPDALIYNFSSKGIERIKYEETEHYRVTHSFLSNPRRMLDILLSR
jgi:hypothetical protein